MKTNWNWRKCALDIAVELLGSFMIAIAFYNFALYAEFPLTGFSGIAMILYRLFGAPMGFTTILLNIPVAIICYRRLGRGFFLRSVRCMVISSLMLDFVAPLFPAYHGERLLSALCIGVFAGLGYALIYMRKSSTGGSDFIIMTVKSYLPHVSIGKIIFLTDVGIIILGGWIFKDIDGIIYGMLINYLFAIVMDKVMYGINAGKLALIVTEQGELVSAMIEEKCGRGSTLIDAKGAYKKEGKTIVMCACSNRQMYSIEQAVKEADPKAFTIILESNEVLGEGFHTTRLAETVQ